MNYDNRTYFEENEAEDVTGFTIVESHDGEYHIAEKWNKSAVDESKWMSYWIPEAQLESRVEKGKCEPKAELKDEQYEKVCSMVDHDNVTAEKVTA
jgi:hypothetical protein